MFNLQHLYRYNQFFCHELNLFLYIKDKDFFNKVVKALIAAKLRKDLMDYFFLGDTENLKQYAEPHLFKNLNPLEKILLAFALKDDNNLQTKTFNYFTKTQEQYKISAQRLDKLLSNNNISLFISICFFWSRKIKYLIRQIPNSFSRETNTRSKPS